MTSCSVIVIHYADLLCITQCRFTLQYTMQIYSTIHNADLLCGVKGHYTNEHGQAAASVVIVACNYWGI